MDRELLIELGTEEMPASWLPGLTADIGTRLEARLATLRLAPAAPIETFSTPRRLVARIARLAERQTDLEEVVTGPPVSAAFGTDGQPTPAALGFAKKHDVEVTALERQETPKGTYLAVRKQHRGRAAVDVLPEALSGLLRDLTFPKAMRWDATLDDGRGELTFGRPIRWILFLYGGRVVPFTIFRTPHAQGPLVQEVRAGAVTYGHRFLTTSGRAGRAIKVKGFDDYRKRLAENFVVLERDERHSRVARELDVEARRRGGRVATALVGHTLLREVPDLVEYPAVVSGTFADEFLRLPEEVLTTTMIHHQHFFPVADDQHRLLPVFLAVLNLQPDKPEAISRNLERVLTARLRDARFFWDADREKPLDAFVDRLDTLLFHKALGTYREKAARIEALARWIAADVLGRPEAADDAATAARLAKADLATDMVRELTELQGTMGGIYAREDGQPEAVWKAIYAHYLPVGVEAEAPPRAEQLGAAKVTWAAVSMADKLDTVVGMFAAGERPTGSRDPYGLRRAAQGLARLLIDLPELTGLDLPLTLGPLVERARSAFAEAGSAAEESELRQALWAFLADRIRFVLEQRGYDVRNVRAVTSGAADALSPLLARRKLEVLPEFTDSSDFRQLATLFKRVRNIAKNLDGADAAGPADLAGVLTEGAEVTLLAELDRRAPIIEGAVASGHGFRQAFAEAAKFGPSVATFFDEVLVMAEDARLRAARLRLMRRLEVLILQLADISEMVPEEK
ncbi:MAG: glycine--tRNA ligase subunit beta [Acidobacteriota bacterium]